MSDDIKKELEAQIALLKSKLSVLKEALEEAELRDNVVQTKHADFQISETFSPMTWKEAMDLPRTLNEKKYLGFDDWYLPSAAELYLILETGFMPRFKKASKDKTYKYDDRGCYQGPVNDQACWSSNSCKSHDQARKVDFDFNSISSLGVTTPCAVICVRQKDKKPDEEQVAPPAEFEDEYDQGLIA